MAAHQDPKDAAGRRASVRRTVWVLAGVATAVYGYFIVKTFLHHAGGGP